MKDASIDDFLDGGGGSEESETDERVDDVADASASNAEDADPASDVDSAAAETTIDTDSAAAGTLTDSETGDTSTVADSGSVPSEPATSTYAWSPDGAICADCGATVDRRWRDGDRLVCVDCKSWEL